MKIAWFRCVFVFSLAFVTCVALMVVSHRVQRAERQIDKIEHRIAAEKESIRVLEAEWAFLNNPERLERLASTLNLVAVEPENMVSNLDHVVEALAAEEVIVFENDAKVFNASYKSSDSSVVSSSVIPSRKPSVRTQNSPMPVAEPVSYQRGVR